MFEKIDDTEKEKINKVLEEIYQEISDSWKDVDLYDYMIICEEAEKYTDSSNIDNMTFEETLKLIEEHNPSFAKEKK